MKVGDYVRTKEGKIGQLVKQDLLEPYITNNIDYYEINKGRVNSNILSLIEVGDLINKKEVVNIIHFEGDAFYRIELFGGKAIMNAKDIKSILTKEQYESMEYKL